MQFQRSGKEHTKIQHEYFAKGFGRGCLKTSAPSKITYVSAEIQKPLPKDICFLLNVGAEFSLDFHHRTVAFKDVDILIQKGDRWHRPRQASQAVNISTINIAVFFTSLSMTENITQCLSLEEKKKKEDNLQLFQML